MGQLYYTPTHEWVSVEGDVGIVGITTYAVKELGEVVYVELPQVGARLIAGKEACVLESTKAAADIYSPVSGVVEAVNPSLPATLNQAPESAGWLYRLRLTDPAELRRLLTPDAYSNEV
jgi:glycine cleavage system H protein